VIDVDPFDPPADDGPDPADDGPGQAEDSAYAVRPYALTGGRTRSPQHQQLPVEALVQSLGDPDAVGLTREGRRILELTSRRFLSVAELSADLEVPVGVVRVLVGDLAQSGQVRVHGATTSSTPAPATRLSVLESVLDAICAL
jgi:uncharacterized protein DUF742